MWKTRDTLTIYPRQDRRTTITRTSRRGGALRNFPNWIARKRTIATVTIGRLRAELHYQPRDLWMGIYLETAPPPSPTICAVYLSAFPMIVWKISRDG